MSYNALHVFIEDARAISIQEAAERLHLSFAKSGTEHPQPCPVSGGKDRFSFNTATNKWNCRHCSVGGQDAIGMAAHCLDLDLSRRAGFLEACAAVLGRDIPAGGERESDEDLAARQVRIEEARRQSDEASADRARQNNVFRDAERRKAVGIYDAAASLVRSGSPAGRFYLQSRTGGIPDDRWLRVSTHQTYWHGADERGQPMSLHVGPAMVAPFVRFGDALAVEIVGCHITWIDLQNAPKYRPALADPETGELLPTKKMRGTKKGGVVPLSGDPAAKRWLGAEGIENTLAFARVERFRGDTFYFAAGDLGNLAGPADAASRFPHPELKKEDRAGRLRPVMIAGPVPAFRDADEPDAMIVPGHVDELVLLADGDSEPVMTASAMTRARERHAREGRLIPVVWSRPGTDFAAMLANVNEAFDLSGVA